MLCVFWRADGVVGAERGLVSVDVPVAMRRLKFVVGGPPVVGAPPKEIRGEIV